MTDIKQNKFIHSVNLTNPLVSIIILTYNSAKYILETLESAKNQNFKNIELIITDDCSTDQTLQICRDWLEINNNRFVRNKIIEVTKNTGTVQNINRGLDEARGVWLKFIAGDDILIDSCIADLIHFCANNPKCKILFGRELLMRNNKVSPSTLRKIAISCHKNQKHLIYTSRPWPGISAPTSFLHRTTLLELGGFDKNYTFLEDLPLWAKYVDYDIRLYFLNKFIVKYRIHDNNITGNRGQNYFNKKLYIDKKKYMFNVLLPYNKKKKNFSWLFYLYNYIIVYELIILFGNRNNFLSKFLSSLVINDSLNKINELIKNKMPQKEKTYV